MWCFYKLEPVVGKATEREPERRLRVELELTAEPEVSGAVSSDIF